MVSTRSVLFSTLINIALVLGARSYDNSKSDNVAVFNSYWGQNSWGAANPSDTSGWQKPIEAYCNDDAIDAIPMAFVNVFFGTGGLPSLNLANSCNPTDNKTFEGSTLPDCSAMAAGIKTCQGKGKIVTISLGGATGAIGFTDDGQATDFADQIWNLFLGGTSDTRPFGDAVLDGIDLDIEGGPTTGYTAFVNEIRSKAKGADKPYYVTAAPQCPFPDGEIGSTLNAVGFDAVYVQFYNNFCGLTNYNNPNAWNYAQWDDWAKNTSPNKDVKVYIGAPASASAAGSGYVDAATLATIATATKSNYTSFGGVMLWDASQAAANGNFAQAIKGALTSAAVATHGHTSAKPSSTVKSSTTSTTSATSATVNGSTISTPSSTVKVSTDSLSSTTVQGSTSAAGSTAEKATSTPKPASTAAIHSKISPTATLISAVKPSSSEHPTKKSGFYKS